MSEVNSTVWLGAAPIRGSTGSYRVRGRRTLRSVAWSRYARSTLPSYPRRSPCCPGPDIAAFVVIPALLDLRRHRALLRGVLVPCSPDVLRAAHPPPCARAPDLRVLPAVRFSKDPPSIAPEPPSPLPGFRITAGPSPIGRYASRMFRPRGFTPPRRLAPRRPCPHCCSGSRSWGSPSFHPIFMSTPAFTNLST